VTAALFSPDEIPSRSPVPAPFVWFGGKRRVAAQVWDALGDVDNYVEPFAGSLAVLLGRPGGTGAARRPSTTRTRTWRTSGGRWPPTRPAWRRTRTGR